MLLNLADMRTRPLARGARLAAGALRRAGVRHGRSAPSIAYAESAERARSILDHRPDLGADYLALADEAARAPARPRRRARAPGARCARASCGPELADVGALRLERRAQHRRPPLDLARAAPRRPRRSARRSTTRARSGRRRRSWRRARPSSRARAGELHERGNRCARRCWCRRSCRPRATRSQSPRASPSISSAACATLKTASPIGTCAGSAARAARVRTGLLRARRPAPRGPSAARSASPARRRTSTKPPCSAAATLSGWPSSSVARPAGRRRARTGGRPRSGRRRSPRRSSRARRTAGSRERIVKVKPSAGCSRSKPARTGSRGPWDRQIGLDGEPPGLLDLELELQRERRGQSRSRARGSPRTPARAPTRRADHPSTARSSAESARRGRPRRPGSSAVWGP